MKKIISLGGKCVAVVSVSLLAGMALNVLAQEACTCCKPVACSQILTSGTCVRNLNSNQAVSSTPATNETGYEPMNHQCGAVWRFGFPTVTPCGQPDADAAC